MAAPQPVLRVQMIGGPTVGKSSFIGALALLAEKPSQGYFVTPIDGATKRRFEDLRASFRQGQWPAKTALAAPIHFRIHHRRQSVTVQLEDFAGEAFLAAMQHGDEDDASRRVESLTGAADVLLLMIDGGKLDSGEPIAGLPLIQALAQRLSAPPPGRANPATRAAHSDVAVAVVVTKTDLAQRSALRTPGAARNRVTQQVPEVAAFLRSHFDRVQWVPLSVCGYDGPCGRQPTQEATDSAAAQAALPATFAPAGFERLFKYWFSLVDQPQLRRRRAIAASFIGLLLIAAVGYYAYTGEVNEQRQWIENPAARLQDLPPEVAAVNQPAYRQRVREAAVQASAELRAARSEREVEQVLRRLSDLPEPAERLAHEELAALRLQGEQRKEELLFARVQDAVARDDAQAIQRTIDEYLQRFPDGHQAQQARQLLAGEEAKRRLRSREAIQAIVVWDNASLQRKLQRITDYLSDWESVLAPNERAAIERATAAARRMLQPHRYRITLVRTSGLDRPREHGVRVSVGGAEAALFNGSGSVSEKIWNREFSVQWQLGMKVDVTLLNYRYRNSEIATFESRGPMAILLLARPNTATRYSTAFASIRPAVQVQFRCAELDDDTLAALEDWIYPGSAW